MSDPDVLFVILDSARTDRVSAYGHTRLTTPRLDAFAEGATRFASALTPAPWTLPAHCSMFTGLYPSEHGTTNGFLDRAVALDPALETLPERLRARGYRTAGFSNNPWVGQLADLHRGFDEFVEWDLEISRDDTAPVFGRRDRLKSRAHGVLAALARQPVFVLKRRYFTATLVDRAVDWLEWTAAREEPTFTFLNLMEAHSPYFPPRRAFRDLDLDVPGPLEPRLLNTKLLAYVLGRMDLPPDRRRRVLEYYDASLRFQDGQLGRLFDTLIDCDTFEEALVVVCSDHGKTLGEHPRDGRPPHYTRPINTDVPLVVKAPGQHAGDVVEGPAELVRLGDLVDRGGERPADVLCAEPVALVEDFVPHTGRSSRAVTRWRVATDGAHRLVRGPDGEEYFPADGAGAPDRSARERLRAGLDDRVARLRDAAHRTGPDGELPAGVAGQLRDLGYLE